MDLPTNISVKKATESSNHIHKKKAFRLTNP